MNAHEHERIGQQYSQDVDDLQFRREKGLITEDTYYEWLREVQADYDRACALFRETPLLAEVEE